MYVHMLAIDHTELGPCSPSARSFRSQKEMLIGSAGLKPETQRKRQLLDGVGGPQSVTTPHPPSSSLLA